MLNRNVCLFDYIVQDKYTQFNQMVQSNCISIIIQFYMALYKFVKYIYIYMCVCVNTCNMFMSNIAETEENFVYFA